MHFDLKACGAVPFGFLPQSLFRKHGGDSALTGQDVCTSTPTLGGRGGDPVDWGTVGQLISLHPQ